MVYTEIRNIRGKKYYYRTLSIRKKGKTMKKRIYMGKNLSESGLVLREELADEKLLAERKKKASKDLEKIKPKIIEILKKNKIKRAGIFGSYARGEQRKNSDIDILIQPTKDMSLLDLSGLKIELEKLLKKKVDLVSYSYIHPHLKDRILDSEVKII